MMLLIASFVLKSPAVICLVFALPFRNDIVALSSYLLYLQFFHFIENVRYIFCSSSVFTPEFPFANSTVMYRDASVIIIRATFITVNSRKRQKV